MDRPADGADVRHDGNALPDLMREVIPEERIVHLVVERERFFGRPPYEAGRPNRVRFVEEAGQLVAVYPELP